MRRTNNVVWSEQKQRHSQSARNECIITRDIDAHGDAGGFRAKKLKCKRSGGRGMSALVFCRLCSDTQICTRRTCSRTSVMSERVILFSSGARRVWYCLSCNEKESRMHLRLHMPLSRISLNPACTYSPILFLHDHQYNRHQACRL